MWAGAPGREMLMEAVSSPPVVWGAQGNLLSTLPQHGVGEGSSAEGLGGRGGWTYAGVLARVQDTQGHPFYKDTPASWVQKASAYRKASTRPGSFPLCRLPLWGRFAGAAMWGEEHGMAWGLPMCHSHLAHPSPGEQLQPSASFPLPSRPSAPARLSCPSRSLPGLHRLPASQPPSLSASRCSQVPPPQGAALLRRPVC